MQSTNHKVLTGKELRRIRRACGLSCEEVAELMLVTKQNIAYLETNKHAKKSSLNYYTLVLKDIWSSIPDSEKSLRLFVADAGNIYGSDKSLDIEDILKNGKIYIQYMEGNYEIF